MASKAKLTLEALQAMKPGQIIASGETTDSPSGCDIASTGKQIVWVAVRGDIADWAIYIDNPYEMLGSVIGVLRLGDKLHNRNEIANLVPCDDEALQAYRH